MSVSGFISRGYAIERFVADSTWLERQGVSELSLEEARQRAVDLLMSFPPEPKFKWLNRTCAKCKFYTADGICVQWSRYGFREEDYCSRWEERDD